MNQDTVRKAWTAKERTEEDKERTVDDREFNRNEVREEKNGEHLDKEHETKQVRK